MGTYEMKKGRGVGGFVGKKGRFRGGVNLTPE